MNESALLFECEGDRMVGIVTPSQPGATARLPDIGVIIVVGGPQYRAGSHRHYVQLARALARHGVLAMRFDTRGMGDGSGRQRTLLEIEADLGASIDALFRAQPHIRRVVFWGLCGGASAALLYWLHKRDERLCGLVLVNPWVRSDETLARTQLKHYYLQRLTQREFWRKVLSGRVAVRAARDLLRNLRLALRRTPVATSDDDSTQPLQHRMAQAWQHFPGPKLLILSSNDYTAKEFIETALSDALWAANLTRSEVTRFDVPGADHTFSDVAARCAVEARTIDWLSKSFAR